MEQKGAFMFLCDQHTESECLVKQLFGTTQANAEWALKVREGDDLYLYNFKTGVVRGPYTASSGADCFDLKAWNGRFPIQVRISKTAFTKEADLGAPSAPALLRKRHPSGDLGVAAAELFRWLQEHGRPQD